MMKKSRAQSTVEYILLLAAIVLAILYGVTQLVAPRASGQLENAGNLMEQTTNTFSTAAGITTP